MNTSPVGRFELSDADEDALVSFMRTLPGPFRAIRNKSCGVDAGIGSWAPGWGRRPAPVLILDAPRQLAKPRCVAQIKTNLIDALWMTQASDAVASLHRSWAR
jgi:hypothetical protein